MVPGLGAVFALVPLRPRVFAAADVPQFTAAGTKVSGLGAVQPGATLALQQVNLSWAELHANFGALVFAGPHAGQQLGARLRALQLQKAATVAASPLLDVPGAADWPPLGGTFHS